MQADRHLQGSSSDRDLVSVVIPCRDGERYVCHAIASVLAQSWRHREVIVVDDGSCDRTAEVVRQFGTAVRLHRQEPAGAGAARNAGVKLARGAFLSFLDADDLWPEDSLSTRMDEFARDPSLDIVVGRAIQFISPEIPAPARSRIVCPEGSPSVRVPGTMLVRREAFARVGRFSTEVVVGEGLDWCMRADEIDLRLLAVDKIVLRRRLHATNLGVVESSRTQRLLARREGRARPPPFVRTACRSAGAPGMSRAISEAMSAWPSAQQELLLTAALAGSDAATAAWEAWKERTDFVADPVDPGSLRLLPLVYRNLAGHGYDGPLMARLEGVYRYWWLRNQRTFNTAADILRTLASRGIDTMVLKGIALSHLYYRDRGVRPMLDVDVMVPSTAASDAVATLTAAGWIETGPRHPSRFRFLHGVKLLGDNGAECDLHWHLRGESTRVDADAVWWRRSVPLDIGSVATRALDPTGNLFHSVAHGVPWNQMPSLRWVADAVTMLSTVGDDIDWDLILRMTVEIRLVVRMRQGLAYLRRRHGAPVPEWVLEALEAAPVAAVERLAEPIMMMDSRRRSQMPLSSARHLLHAYLRITADCGAVRGTVEFPNFLMFRLGIHRRRQFPVALLRKMASKFTQFGSQSPAALQP